MITVAALYTDARGPYHSMPGVDAWDITRDARKYEGPYPVICHPPCGPWGRLRHLYRGNEHDCAPRAVEQVRRWGGVLEHPAGSELWEACGLPLPEKTNALGNVLDQADGESPRVRKASVPRNTGGALAMVAAPVVDAWGGYSIEISQVEWGHVARKRTWLYLVGVPREALEAPPFPGREPTHYASGGRTKSSRNGGAVPVGMKVCSAQQRRRTPPALAEYLVRLARSVEQKTAAA